MNAVSFSLHIPDDARGDYFSRCAMASIDSVRRLYPEYRVVLHCDATVPNDVITLADDVIRWPVPADTTYMFWRYTTVGCAKYDAVLVRDIDSLCGNKEAPAVSAWVRSDRSVHTMLDNPAHTARVMGGMWGAKRNALPYDFSYLVRWWINNKCPFSYGSDEWFLMRYIWPYAERGGMNHHYDNYTSMVETVPFPQYTSAPTDPEFIGARIV